MANVNNPHGLQPLGISIHGGPNDVEEFSKASGNGQAIFRFDPVARQADGTIGADSITPGTTLYSGVALDYGAASTATTHKVITSPGALFEAQGTGSIAAADMGLNANLNLSTAGSATTKNSGAQIDASAMDTNAAKDVHMRKLYADGVNAYGNYARIEVVFNKHRMNGGVAGV